MKIGTQVEHKEYTFGGVIVENHWSPNNVVIYITEGEHPFDERQETYVANVANLTVKHDDSADAHFYSVVNDMFNDVFRTNIEFETEKKVEGSTEVSTEEKTNGFVDVKLPDGTEMNFEFYADYLDFMKVIQQQQ